MADEGRIQEIERAMRDPAFWQDHQKASRLAAELNELKRGADEGGGGSYDQHEAILSLQAGAGGEDAEDWARILLRMYTRFAERRGWKHILLHEHRNEQDGIKNVTIQIVARGAYGLLKTEKGVHRLVRISPYSAKKLRHTSFAYVEVLPYLKETREVEIREEDLEWDFSRSGGAGGQNVNKRATAARVTHKPTGMQVRAETERSQADNRAHALAILKAKLLAFKEDARQRELQGLKGGAPVKIEWGNQIRSYVLHPYKMVKDHRTGVETSKVEEVLEGNLDLFI